MVCIILIILYSNIIFNIKDTNIYVPEVVLSAKSNQKLLNILSKGFERSVYWNKQKPTSENKNTTESNFVEVDRLFAFIYSNEDANINMNKASKVLFTQRYYQEI